MKKLHKQNLIITWCSILALIMVSVLGFGLSVMAIGFVSAGLMTLPQAISIIFGANIGTTMTAQIIAFKLSDYIYVTQTSHINFSYAP